MKYTVEQVVARIKKLSKALNKPPQKISYQDLKKSGMAERQILALGGLPLIKSRHFPIEEQDFAQIREMSNDVKYIRRLEANLSSALLLEKKLESAIKSVPAVRVTPYKTKDRPKIKRVLNAIFSDLHIGSDLKKENTGVLDFGKKEEARRLARLTKEIIDYKPQYRQETELKLSLLGDIIENKLHDPMDAAPLSEQVARAIFLLTQAVAQFSQSFPKVTVICNTGNHGRNTSRHPGRAVNDKWDSIETVIYYAVKQAVRELKNVEVLIPKTPFVVYENFGKKIFCTHGDTVLNAGYPGKAIKTGVLEHQINRINASLNDKDEYSVFIVGHVHVASMTHLNNNAVMITNGAMVPANEFAVSLGLLESAAGQYMFESVEGFVVGDCRFIKVSEKDDANPTLDQIIKPFTNL